MTITLIPVVWYKKSDCEHKRGLKMIFNYSLLSIFYTIMITYSYFFFDSSIAVPHFYFIVITLVGPWYFLLFVIYWCFRYHNYVMLDPGTESIKCILFLMWTVHWDGHMVVISIPLRLYEMRVLNIWSLRTT
jgi:hypothetical protein